MASYTTLALLTLFLGCFHLHECGLTSRRARGYSPGKELETGQRSDPRRLYSSCIAEYLSRKRYTYFKDDDGTRALYPITAHRQSEITVQRLPGPRRAG
ncbi:hypothetical protein F5Y01DRAFT_286355 [Xylaria sp. FL0043]|nr:hypothetical protein F5Y01DRAFT_286355 [Xylaria sp. FL0043]